MRHLIAAVLTASFVLVGTSAYAQTRIISHVTSPTGGVVEEKGLCVVEGRITKISSAREVEKCDTAILFKAGVLKAPGGGTRTCKDPDGDFKHCNDTCSSVPQTPSEGSTGCSLGCLAAYVWDGIWCD